MHGSEGGPPQQCGGPTRRLGRALRTETTINDTGDFGIGRRLCNLPALREVGLNANRRLLDVERLSHDPHLGDQGFAALVLK